MTSAVESGEISLTLPDGSVRTVTRGTTGADLAMAISPRLAKAALAVTVDDQLTDLMRPFEGDARVRIVTERDPEALHLYRHSTAHLLAAAVLELFPGTQCGIGPALDDGFYYDFVVQRPFVPEDLAAIEQRMKEIAARDLPFVRELRPKEDAKAHFAARGEPLKVQLIDEKSGPVATCYDIKGVFLDFCVGPHVPSVGKLGHFKLTSTSSAYWKGDAKNQPMQRVYGTAFFSKNELEQYLHRLEEAKKRDHRRLGKDLGLFLFHPWAPGAAFWLAKGTTVYHTIANYMRDVLLPNGYVELKTPLVFNKALWETSGHWQHYRQNMFLIDNDEEQMAMKAMNCPGHMLVFASETPQLSRPAAALPRADAAAPQRGVGRALGPDPRPAVLAGRRPLLRDGVADRRGSRAAAPPRAAGLRRLRPRVQRQAVDSAGRVPRRDRDLGSRRSRAAARAWRRPARPTPSTRAMARSTGRRSTSRSPTRSAASGSARPSSSTTSCRSAST